MGRHSLAALLTVCCVSLTALADDDACLKCHANAERLKEALGESSRDLAPLLVDAERFKNSVHASRGCADCHFDFDTQPHGKDAETAKCSECHDDAAKAFAESVHGGGAAEGKGVVVSCQSCHGLHDVMRPTTRESRLHPLNVLLTCGKCHFDRDPATMTRKEILAQHNVDDNHAFAIQRSTLIPSCVTCHGGHQIRSVDDSDSPVNRLNLTRTCEKCHLGVSEEYRTSVHGRPGDNTKRAVCSDCHPPHVDPPHGDQERFLQSVVCAKCHESRALTYLQTYHGKVNRLGWGDRVATCFACHGSHGILEESNPLSRINPANRVETCKQCHAKAHAGFARYQVHADPTDPERSPGLNQIYVAMRGLLLFVFVFFGLHSLLWLVRSVAAGEWRRRNHGPQRYVRRWPVFYSTLHVLMMTSFLMLTATGLPLHFSERHWATVLMQTFGGPPVAGFIHRTAAVTMIGTIVTWLVNFFWRVVVKREKGLWMGPNSMVPRFKDLQDFWGNLRWFLFLGKKPGYDRWTYWEKFDFWAVFWGIALIGGTGLILWFPEALTHIVPAWMINVAVVVHGHEALLAVGFIFTVHMFHNLVRPEKFPMDTLYLTGRITEEELMEERPFEYERVQQEGRFESLLADPPTPGIRAVAYILGGTVAVLGMLFVGMMILASL